MQLGCVWADHLACQKNHTGSLGGPRQGFEVRKHNLWTIEAFMEDRQDFATQDLQEHLLGAGGTSDQNP